MEICISAIKEIIVAVKIRIGTKYIKTAQIAYELIPAFRHCFLIIVTQQNAISDISKINKFKMRPWFLSLDFIVLNYK